MDELDSGSDRSLTSDGRSQIGLRLLREGCVHCRIADGRRPEIHDLLHLAVSGEIDEPSSDLGIHVHHHWEDLAGPSNQSFVHWIRRLVFRGAWLDQRVKEGELDIVFDERRQSFGYIQPDRGPETIELAKEPSWRRVAFQR